MPEYLDPRSIGRLRTRLLAWYETNRRDLPWRRTRDPYVIWVSEIMLQQTRVAAVLDAYGKFLARFPDVKALAAANVNAVLAIWSGLGYYRRARALHEAARAIVRDGGVMPRTAEQWRQLPGVGRYTAAAIASIAHGEPCAVVDGNVERVLRRFSGERSGPSEAIWEMAQTWLSRTAPGDFNQAMMELGATVCLPAAPRCEVCPVAAWCKTRSALPGAVPAARKKKAVAYALTLRKTAVYLTQRGATERLMPGMWELPEIGVNGHAPEFVVRHAITVTDYRVAVYRTNRRHRDGRWIKFDRLHTIPLTGLTRKILRRAQII